MLGAVPRSTRDEAGRTVLSHSEFPATHPHPRLRPSPPGSGFRATSWILVELDIGDVLIFRGDVEHYGVGYSERHLRGHAYKHGADFKKDKPSIYTK